MSLLDHVRVLLEQHEVAHALIGAGALAGGTQDLWDIRELLSLPDAATLVADVSADLEPLSPDMRARWDEARR